MASLWLLVVVMTIPDTEASNRPHGQDGGPRQVKRKRDGQGKTSTPKPTLVSHCSVESDQQAGVRFSTKDGGTLMRLQAYLHHLRKLSFRFEKTKT